MALEELDVGGAGLGGVALREGQHLVGHVEAERPTGRADALRGEQDIDATAGPEVEHALALVQVGDGRRVATAERREHGGIRQLVALEGASRGRRRSSRGRCNTRRPGDARTAAAA